MKNKEVWQNGGFDGEKSKPPFYTLLVMVEAALLLKNPPMKQLVKCPIVPEELV